MSTAEAMVLLRSWLATSPEAIGICSGGIVQSANPPLVELLGYDDESELVGRSIFEIAAPAGHEFLAELWLRRETSHAQTEKNCLRLQRRDGSLILIDLRHTSFRVAGGVITLTFMSEAEAQTVPAGHVPPNTDFYRALFEVNSAVKLLICPLTGHIVDANQAAADLYGWPLDVLRSMRITDINTLSPAEVQAEMDAARSRRRGYFRFRHRTADGGLRHVEVHSGPVEVEGAQLLLSIVHDVTERDQLEEQLRRAERLEAVGRLAGGIAHDFNNLLTIMLTSTRMLGKKLDSGSPLRRHLDDLSHAAQRAAELSTGMLAFGGSSAFNPAAIDLGASVRQILRLLRRTLPATIQIDSELARDLPDVYADPTQVEQVIVNLALNARDAMPHGGVLLIRTGLRVVIDDELSLVPAGHWITLAISDTGVGMDESTRAHAFEPFFTTKTSTGGTGLGLARVYGIVAQSGGHVTLDSEPNLGTTFTIYLAPAPETATRPAPASERNAPGFATPSTILLVEDTAMVREVLADAFEEIGFSVISASSADEVLALPADVLAGVDAVVSDIVMHGASGFDLVARLLEDRPDLPVVLMSGHDGHLDASSLPRSVCFLQKPFDFDRLLEALETARESASG